jgi:hypothetical protein
VRGGWTPEKVAPTCPHPTGANSEQFHKLVRPDVGLVDWLRHKLTDRSHG